MSEETYMFPKRPYAFRGEEFVIKVYLCSDVKCEDTHDDDPRIKSNTIQVGFMDVIGQDFKFREGGVGRVIGKFV